MKPCQRRPVHPRSPIFAFVISAFLYFPSPPSSLPMVTPSAYQEAKQSLRQFSPGDPRHWLIGFGGSEFYTPRCVEQVLVAIFEPTKAARSTRVAVRTACLCPRNNSCK